jgi:hypothetical protein
MNRAAITLAGSDRESLRAPRKLVYLAAALSLAAGYVHFAYADSHFEQWWAYGLFFVAAGNLQILLAILLVWRPRPWLPIAGIVGNLVVVALYVITRTDGIPIGPHARVVEDAGTLDWATTAAQVAIIAALIAMLEGSLRRWMINGLMALGALAWLLRLTGHL